MKWNYKPHGSRCTPCCRHEVCMRSCHAWVLQFNYSRVLLKFNLEMRWEANGMFKSFPLQHWILSFLLLSACQYLPFYQSCRLGVMPDFFPLPLSLLSPWTSPVIFPKASKIPFFLFWQLRLISNHFPLDLAASLLIRSFCITHADAKSLLILLTQTIFLALQLHLFCCAVHCSSTSLLSYDCFDKGTNLQHLSYSFIHSLCLTIQLQMNRTSWKSKHYSTTMIFFSFHLNTRLWYRHQSHTRISDIHMRPVNMTKHLQEPSILLQRQPKAIYSVESGTGKWVDETRMKY